MISEIGYTYKVTYIDSNQDKQILIVCSRETSMDIIGKLAEDAKLIFSDEFSIINSIEYIGHTFADE